MTENQQQRLNDLESYVRRLRQEENRDEYTNILAYIVLIQGDQ